MAWIESHQTLGRHPKVEKLAKILKIHKAQAIGHLHLLWWWCLDYAQDGSLVSLTNLDIADAAGWTKQPDLFVDAMVTCGVTRNGFLDRSGSGFVVHDWHQYAGRLIEKRRGDYERLKRFRNAAKAQPDTPDDTQDETHVDTQDETRINSVTPCVSNEVTNTTNRTNRTNLEEEEKKNPPPPTSSELFPSAALELSPQADQPSAEDLMAVWNSNRGPLPKVNGMTNGRKPHARARLAETPDLARWTSATKRLAASPFCRGENDRRWKADFDFLLQPDTLTKIEEGKYDARKPPPSSDFRKPFGAADFRYKSTGAKT